MAFAVSNSTVLIGDGGLATELEARGHDLSDDQWSARLLLDAPDEIVAAHAAFYRADAERLMRRSVELALAARDEVGGDGRWVAVSVGPYGAALANGEEYIGRYGLTVAQLADWHLPRLEILADAGADVLAIETVPDIDEAEALVGLARRLGVPAWLSYTISGLHTRAGQPLAEAFAVVADVPEIVAVGVNCCAPADVLPAIQIAREVTDKPVIVYPNSGEEWDGEHRTWIGNSRWSSDLAPQWVAAGARIVGGCCRVMPDDIAELSRTISPS